MLRMLRMLRNTFGCRSNASRSTRKPCQRKGSTQKAPFPIPKEEARKGRGATGRKANNIKNLYASAKGSTKVFLENCDSTACYLSELRIFAALLRKARRRCEADLHPSSYPGIAWVPQQSQAKKKEGFAGEPKQCQKIATMLITIVINIY